MAGPGPWRHARLRRAVGQLRSGQEVTVNVHDGLLAFTADGTRKEPAGARTP